MNMFDQVCKHCGFTARQLLLFAMMQEAGASNHNGDGEFCTSRDGGGEHEFAYPREADKAA